MDKTGQSPSRNSDAYWGQTTPPGATQIRSRTQGSQLHRKPRSLTALSLHQILTGGLVNVFQLSKRSLLQVPLFAGMLQRQASGRANTALHLLHLGGAFIVQWATGVIVDLWQLRNAAHPAEAYQAAFAVNVAMQAAAMIWFALPDTGRLGVQVSPARTPALLWQAFQPQASIPPYNEARRQWNTELAAATAHRDSWRFAALGSTSLSVVLVGLVVHGR